MKLFLDTANIDTIKKWLNTRLINGITTNPTHLSKENNNPTTQIKKICSLMKKHGDVSVEVTEQKPDAVYKQAQAIAKLAPNVVVKIPCAQEYYEIIKKLIDKKIKINSTLIFSLEQALIMAKLGAYYISPFIGRLDDIGGDGLKLIEEIREILDTYEYKSQLLAASIRSVDHIHNSMLVGADIATIPATLLEKMSYHPLTEIGMEKFDSDWKKLKIKKFPS